VIIGVYAGGAIGFAAFLLAGSSIVGLWAGIVVMGLFSFAESPQLQALLADIAPPTIRDASFALYFTLAFGMSSLWTILYGTVIDTLGEPTGLPIVFWLMAASFILAALAVVPVRAGRRAA
jgi:MFS family permease